MSVGIRWWDLCVLCCVVMMQLACDGHYVDDGMSDALLCRRCGHEIAIPSDITTVISQRAVSRRNESIHHNITALVQLFTNPQGHSFEVITALRANYTAHGDAYLEFTWFPGFKWTIIACPVCGVHIGWSFEAADGLESGNVPKKFVGLILSRLLHESVVESLILTPRAYRTA
ncbi:protein cereblon-like [Corticium candelabrum]|uniref:protein cereblon-like n=1 Tax=Corticium candelabrum TaxID=121492 RepID=UPI002E267D43|nr:protein cereblon-like [Corticium candelabrum]